jgi:histidine triad (HIT) family protein
MANETIFSKLIRGEVPCHKLYEDPLVFAFLDVAPLAPGHTLLVPKRPAPTMDALDDDSAAALGRVLPRLCRAVMAATGTSDYNLLQNNGGRAHQAVPHVHVHIVPRPSDDVGLSLAWRPQPLADGERLAAAIARALAG